MPRPRAIAKSNVSNTSRNPPTDLYGAFTQEPATHYSNDANDHGQMHTKLLSQDKKASADQLLSGFADPQQLRERAILASMELSNDTVLLLELQNSSRAPSICSGLIYRSTVLKGSVVVSQKFSRLGGIVSVTDMHGTTHYGVTCGHGLVNQVLDALPGTFGRDDNEISSDSSCSDSDDDQSVAMAPNVAIGSHANRTSEAQVILEADRIKEWANVSEGLLAEFLEFHAVSSAGRLIGIVGSRSRQPVRDDRGNLPGRKVCPDVADSEDGVWYSITST